MPTPQSIVANLELIANGTIAIAVAWHSLALAALLALLLGWKPSRRAAGALLETPIVSVSIVSFIYGNPFNGTLFALLALVLGGIAARLGRGRVHKGGPAATLAGILMLAFGWLYPHFLDSHSAAIYLVAAPTGVIPCPTLSLSTGFALLAGGLGSRAWSVVLGGAGLFYGFFGVFRLGVPLDIVLVAGAAALLVTTLGRQARALARPA
ncbi:MAG TPA: hypothetical protein VNO55_18175 [Polyangia bacterium]|nr:hypothetical protein [Polyangia bacterium]